MAKLASEQQQHLSQTLPGSCKSLAGVSVSYAAIRTLKKMFPTNKSQHLEDVGCNLASVYRRICQIKIDFKHFFKPYASALEKISRSR